MEKDIDNVDEILARVQRVSPPPYLMTRIEAKLDAGYSNRYMSWLAIGAVTVLLVVNVVVISSTQVQSMNADSMSMLETMNIETSNQLYHE